MARNMFPAGSPIGRHNGVDSPKSANSHEAIGVVKDDNWGAALVRSRYWSLGDEDEQMPADL